MDIYISSESCDSIKQLTMENYILSESYDPINRFNPIHCCTYSKLEPKLSSVYILVRSSIVNV